ncbi:MAG: UDP-N-acetylmuramoyl-tripeptide--D-alanyl-D-alanine ligase [Patescibacteria group bacterium]|nr:UDP-N-acetylmuramoyl-tripeptide--D-alanyl-D-alanine ligase [Patescibacteria group bacterium]
MKKFLQKYLGACARRAILREKTRVIAVAGSVGKTSTKHAIGIALGAYETGSRVRVSSKNYNNEWGVPLTVFNRDAPGRNIFSWIGLLLRATLTGLGLGNIGARTLVLEYATDHPGDLAYLISIAQPEIAVMTAIGPEHTEFFETVRAVAEEELTIIKSLDKDGVAILNGDDSEVMEGREMTEATVVAFGECDSCDIRLESCDLVYNEQDPGASGLDVKIAAVEKPVHAHLRGVFGTPHALAVTAALAVVYALDEDFYEAADRLEKEYHGMPGRTRILSGIKHTVLLDDSYNSSPLAAHSAIRDLISFPITEGRKRIAAMGDMLELGNLAEQAHEDLGRKIAEAGIDILVVCGTLAHIVADAAKEAGMSEENIFVFDKSTEAGLFIQDRMKSGDVILIKGSQGSRMEKITKELMAEPLRATELLVRQEAKWK